jgi:F0F1-type ATP synthase assembly protein I
MMIIPAIVGYFIDQRLSTLILFTALGLMVGMAAAIWQLVKFVAMEDRLSKSDQENNSSE